MKDEVVVGFEESLYAEEKPLACSSNKALTKMEVGALSLKDLTKTGAGRAVMSERAQRLQTFSIEMFMLPPLITFRALLLFLFCLKKLFVDINLRRFIDV